MFWVFRSYSFLLVWVGPRFHEMVSWYMKHTNTPWIVRITVCPAKAGRIGNALVRALGTRQRRAGETAREAAPWCFLDVVWWCLRQLGWYLFKSTWLECLEILCNSTSVTLTFENINLRFGILPWPSEGWKILVFFYRCGKKWLVDVGWFVYLSSFQAGTLNTCDWYAMFFLYQSRWSTNLIWGCLRRATKAWRALELRLGRCQGRCQFHLKRPKSHLEAGMLTFSGPMICFHVLEMEWTWMNCFWLTVLKMSSFGHRSSRNLHPRLKKPQGVTVRRVLHTPTGSWSVPPGSPQVVLNRSLPGMAPGVKNEVWNTNLATHWEQKHLNFRVFDHLPLGMKTAPENDWGIDNMTRMKRLASRSECFSALAWSQIQLNAPLVGLISNADNQCTDSPK